MQAVNIFTTWCILAWLIAGPTSLSAAEKDLYDFLWLDPDKKVYVLQNKIYKKKNTIYAQLGYIYGLSSDYTDSSGLHFSTGYYFNEEWALELMYNSYSNSFNDAYQNLQAINQSVPFVRKLDKSYGALAIWAPFYGKINTFNKIIYFDWHFGLGMGKVDTSSNALTVASSTTADTYQNESYTGVLAKTGLRVHASKRWHVDLSYLRTTYNAPGPLLPNRGQTDKWRANGDVILSIGFSF
ncbi:MAG: hypothetical protein Fur0010_26680 [Bdellovibrio sp.]